MSSSFLDRICARARADVAQSRARVPFTELADRPAPPVPSFSGALDAQPGVALIAECKMRSPSAGVLREPYDPVELARVYQRAGAAAVSCLTNEHHFGGSMAQLEAVARVVDIPVLRKEFIVDEYQIWEARAAGAAAVLLIAAALPGAELARLLESCAAASIEALVEVHDSSEMTRAQASGARVIGINNRNLNDFSVDPSRALALAAERTAGIRLVAESGVESPGAVELLRDAGFDAVLVGTALVRERDPEPLARSLILAGEVR